ncbi:alpha/beta fold hydrolase [Dyella flagellata]|uniref:Alpha/beta hydrolase n=1 Tax=Dyella flagellata TaxID=1867833 RepID=A0ABQ5XGM2_9GAMM|nr:alpha/beta hydrolase [Dyella flagellata]GLQ89781.1 alpha/beta hydrolase [Dyella flagellata]
MKRTYAALALSFAAFASVAQAEDQPAQAPVTQAASQAPWGALKHVHAGVLDVAYAEMGPANGPVVILLHGWPYDIHSYTQVAPALAAKGYRVLVPYARGYGQTRFLSDSTVCNAEPAALAEDVIDFMDALHIKQAELAGFDWGARSADIVAALWPERVKALVSVSGYLIGSQESGKTPLPPKAELQWWYQYYFATERGRAGYDKYRHDFAKQIWQLASPSWKFDDATFETSAQALDNPDQVAITVHNYRWRLDLAKGETKYAALEQRLAHFPAITVPTITLEGDANGAPHPLPEAYAKKFTGKYQFRLISGGIGHNLPEEAPQAFTRAVIDADHL